MGPCVRLDNVVKRKHLNATSGNRTPMQRSSTPETFFFFSIWTHRREFYVSVKRETCLHYFRRPIWFSDQRRCYSNFRMKTYLIYCRYRPVQLCVSSLLTFIRISWTGLSVRRYLPTQENRTNALNGIRTHLHTLRRAGIVQISHMTDTVIDVHWYTR